MPEMKTGEKNPASVTQLSNPIQAKNKEPTLWNDLCRYMEDGHEIAVQ